MATPNTTTNERKKKSNKKKKVISDQHRGFVGVLYLGFFFSFCWGFFCVDFLLVFFVVVVGFF